MESEVEGAETRQGTGGRSGRSARSFLRRGKMGLRRPAGNSRRDLQDRAGPEHWCGFIQAVEYRIHHHRSRDQDRVSTVAEIYRQVLGCVSPISHSGSSYPRHSLTNTKLQFQVEQREWFRCDVSPFITYQQYFSSPGQLNRFREEKGALIYH